MLRGGMSRYKFAAVIILIIILAGSFWIFSSSKRNKEPKFRLENIEKGDITATVTATGTLSALTTVAVGSQVSGIISRLYVDFNSNVKKGQLLAELDPTPFQALVDQRSADLVRAQAELRNTKLIFERSKNLMENQFISRQEYDTAESNVNGAEATVKQAEAAMRQAETNLSYTKIVSPIDGVVVNRAYDIGQTVAASFQAPTLFTIAQDLARMQVSTNIDEADIGKIKLGQKATFSVDAFPDETFMGKISQIRLSSAVVQNVVTYPVLIDVANPDLTLKPGMTANVSIPVEQLTNVMKIPNSALRFQPDPLDVEGDVKEGGIKKEAPIKKRGTIVYMMTADGKLRGIPVQTSITDGTYTAIQSDQLKEGMPIVAGMATTKAMDSKGGMMQSPPRSGRRPF
jgi:HlyD family secretion protein